MLRTFARHKTAIVAMAMLTACVGVTLAGRYTPENVTCKAVIYVPDPAATLAGTSGCKYCNQLVKDLEDKYAREGDYGPVVGTAPDAVFRVMKAPESVKRYPLTVFYYSNGQKDFIAGYLGNYRDFSRKHSGYNGEHKQEWVKLARYERAVDIAPDSSLAYNQEPTEQNVTPFLPEYPAESQRKPYVDPNESGTAVQLVQCGLSQATPFGFSPYASNCAASSYAAPYVSSCNGGGGGVPGNGGGGGFYTPPQAYYAPQYQQAYYPPQNYYQPRYAAPNYGSYGYGSYASTGGGGRMICVNGQCFIVP